jgi:hypothetical protein
MKTFANSPFRRRYCALYIVHLQAFSERQEGVRYRPLRCSNPRLTRTAPRTSAGEISKAARTWEGCTLPEEQAASEETAMPYQRYDVIGLRLSLPKTPSTGVTATSESEHDCD